MININLVSHLRRCVHPGQGAIVSSGSPNWLYLIPQLHRALANPEIVTEMPDYNLQPDLWEQSAYWETAVYLMQYLLGWSDPGRGLQWFNAHCSNTLGDPRLEILNAVWNYDQQLDYLGVWFYLRGKGVCPFLQKLNKQNHEGELAPREGIDYLGREWWRDFRRRQSELVQLSKGCAFNGSEGLHFGHSNCIQYENPETKFSGSFSKSEPQSATATLLLNRALDWYYWLNKCGETLPNIGERSWKVDVIAKPIGWLGQFRQSRVTGLWFQGKHSIHMQGS